MLLPDFFLPAENIFDGEPFFCSQQPDSVTCLQRKGTIKHDWFYLNSRVAPLSGLVSFFTTHSTIISYTA